MHGFGLKVQALRFCGAERDLASADSLAWSYGSRRRKAARDLGWQHEKHNASATAPRLVRVEDRANQRTMTRNLQPDGSP